MESDMHDKKHLAHSEVIGRPPTVNVTLPHATVEAIDMFIRNVGISNGIRSRSAAMQFIIEGALAGYGVPRCPADAPVQTPETEGEREEVAGEAAPRAAPAARSAGRDAAKRAG